MSVEELFHTIAHLRQQGTDDASVEVKSSASSLSKDVWDSVSAFANTHGGTIILGLSEADGFTPVARFEIDKVIDQFVSGIGDGGEKGRLTRPPAYELSREIFEGSQLLIIRIVENSPGSKPSYVTAKGLTGGSFKRVDDKDIALSASEIFELQTALIASDADNSAVDDSSVEDLDEILTEDLLARRSESRAFRGAKNDEEKLTRINVLKRTGQITLPGLLTLGKYPQQYFPRLHIDVAAHPANEKSPPTSEVRFLDRVQCDGPLAEAIDTAFAAIRRNLKTHSIVIGSQRTDRLEIPPEVLREALGNAAVHREYSSLFLGQPITVDIYPDRVEITNPGGLWGGKTIENLDDGASRCRNPKLMQLLQITAPRNGSGYPVEGQGSGVRLMINKMEADALDRPRFINEIDQFRVVLARHGAEIPEHRNWLHDLADRDFTPHEDAALVIAKRSGSVSVAQLRTDLHIDSDDARTILSTLEKEGMLQASGPETYGLADGSPLPTETELIVFQALSSEVPLNIHEIASLTGRTPNTLRPLLRELITKRLVSATAPPTSKNRRYLAIRDGRTPL